LLTIVQQTIDDHLDSDQLRFIVRRYDRLELLHERLETATKEIDMDELRHGSCADCPYPELAHTR
jgi:hypothetical protein